MPNSKLSILSSALRSPLTLMLSIGLHLGAVTVIEVNAAENIPGEVSALITQIDKTASRHDLKDLMNFYNPQFTHSDGLTYESIEQILKRLWEEYPDLEYRTKIRSWEQKDDKWIMETVTIITGTRQLEAMMLNLQSKIVSRQEFQDQKLLRQEILSEETQITSGESPPTVEVRLPKEVRIGEAFDFDVIVQEPLGNDFLLGSAIEETIGDARHLNPAELDLEILQAGGLFKRVKAPDSPQGHWLSAIVIRGGGAVIVTHRVSIKP